MRGTERAIIGGSIFNLDLKTFDKKISKVITLTLILITYERYQYDPLELFFSKKDDQKMQIPLSPSLSLTEEPREVLVSLKGGPDTI